MANKLKQTIRIGVWTFVVIAVSWAGSSCSRSKSSVDSDVTAVLERMGVSKGICVLLGVPENNPTDFVTRLAGKSELLIYFQSPNGEEVAAVRRAADAAALLGKRVFVEKDGRIKLQGKP